MTQPQERMDHLAHEVGERLGLWAGRFLQRMQQTAGALNEEADNMDILEEEPHPHRAEPAQASQPEPAQTSEPEHIQSHWFEQATMERAEGLVDRVGAYVGHWTVEGNQRLRRALAHLQEDMEDFWVETHEKQKTHHEETHKHKH